MHPSAVHAIKAASGVKQSAKERSIIITFSAQWNTSFMHVAGGEIKISLASRLIAFKASCRDWSVVSSDELDVLSLASFFWQFLTERRRTFSFIPALP